jgi:hypothetical protein
MWKNSIFLVKTTMRNSKKSFLHRNKYPEKVEEFFFKYSKFIFGTFAKSPRNIKKKINKIILNLGTTSKKIKVVPDISFNFRKPSIFFIIFI